MASVAPATRAAAPGLTADLAGSQAFISYSRADRAFVRQLHEGLTSRGLSVWVDFEDIPPTAEWLAGLYTGIERAEAFLFVISPDSLASEMCQIEVLHALKHGKRIVPILRRAASVGPPLEALGKPQWIDAREDAEFKLALATVLQALETDHSPAAQIRAFGQPPPKRMCAEHVAQFHAFADREVPCAGSGCTTTWLWTRAAQLAQLQKTGSDEPPARSCDTCK
jgi:hypothetical protein